MVNLDRNVNRKFNKNFDGTGGNMEKESESQAMARGKGMWRIGTGRRDTNKGIVIFFIYPRNTGYPS